MGVRQRPQKGQEQEDSVPATENLYLFNYFEASFNITVMKKNT